MLCARKCTSIITLPLPLALGTDSHVGSRPEFTFKMEAKRSVSIDLTSSLLLRAARRPLPQRLWSQGRRVTDDCSAFSAADHATLPGRDDRIVIPSGEYLGKDWTIASSGEIVQGMRVGYIGTGTLRTACYAPARGGRAPPCKLAFGVHRLVPCSSCCQRR